MFVLRLFVFFILLYSTTVFGQAAKDSLVRFSDLNFTSNQERQLFTTYLQNKDTSVLLDLFLIPSNPSKTISKKVSLDKINECVNYIEANFNSAKTNAKRTKLIYDYVHKSLLKVYKLDNAFSDVFISGEYNCVSASALYAFIFSKTNVPYAIKEKPTHVYLFAYPNADKILIETTSPDFGYYQFSSQFVDKYVQQLYNSKQISKEEYDSQTVNDLFNKYFFTDKDISLRQLLGLQFFNFGIFSSDKKDYKQALEWYKKAYLIYPSKKTYFIMQNALYEQLSNTKYKEFSDVSNFLMLLRYAEQEGQESNRNDVLNEFIRIKDAQLVNANDMALFKKSYQLIAADIKDSVSKADISFVYWYELSRVATLTSKNDSIDHYLYEAYKLKPTNVDLRSLITHRALNKLSNYSDAKKVYSDLAASIEKYPFLKEHDNVNEIISNCYLDLSFQAFAQQKSSKGEEYMKLFENGVTENTLASINQRYVERTYSEACAYYYRIGNKTKAKAVLLQGLKYAPDNFGLNERLRQIH
ncbi:MAG: hypothetical protein JWM14_1625 [Chitinophagaceae bacterium]|nr:hypothetical protein [Chitinophagaceae bacterium]